MASCPNQMLQEEIEQQYRRWSGGDVRRALTAFLIPTVMFIVIGVLSSGAVQARAIQANGTKTVWDGVYTDAQATRGKDRFAAVCTACHADDLTGGIGGVQSPAPRNSHLPVAIPRRLYSRFQNRSPQGPQDGGEGFSDQKPQR